MRSAAAAMLLNFLFLPLGYFYLKNAGRFVIGCFFAIFSIPLFSLLSWLFALFLPVRVIAPLIVVLGLGLIILIALDSYLLSRQPVSQKPWRIFSKPHAFWFIPVYLLCIGGAGIVLEPWERPFAATHNIPSPSMEPNIQVGDLVYANYIINTNHLRRSDIVIHQGLGYYRGKRLIKRIIALPGDRIRILAGTVAGPDGKPFEVTRYELNGKLIPLVYAGPDAGKFKLQESQMRMPSSLFIETAGNRKYYILEDEGRFAPPEQEARERVMGPDEFFLMGDNRDHAADSRYEGTVQRSQIIGKYMHTYFSFFIPNPDCEITHPTLLLWQSLTAPKNSACHAISIRWEKAGYLPPLW